MDHNRRSRGRACDRPHRQLWLVDRPHLATWLGLAILLPIAALTLVPANRDLAVGFATKWELPTLGAVDLVANLVHFIPPALLFGVAVLRPLIVLFGASIGSVLVEVTQAYVTALGRSCSTNDWLAPTLGSALGVAIAALASGSAALLKARPPPCSDASVCLPR